MPKFTAAQTFPSATGVYPPGTDAMVVIDANGGTVTVEADLGDGTWIGIPGSPFSADTVFQMGVGNGRFRFTPASGAFYGFTA